MTLFRFQGISESVAVEVRSTMLAPEYGHPAHREIAQGYGPCRVCLRTFAIGSDERILFTYQPFLEQGSLPAPGPIFIHAEACVRYDAVELPADFRSMPLVFEAYKNGGRLLSQERVGSQDSEETLRKIFDGTNANYVHIRNGQAGCFMARVERPGE